MEVKLQDFGIEINSQQVPNSLNNSEEEHKITMTEQQLEELLENVRRDAYEEGFSNGVSSGMSRGNV